MSYGERKMSAETIIDVVKAYPVGKPDSLVVVIPKTVREILNFKAGQRFCVKIDEQRRLIYEPIERSEPYNHQTKKEAET